MCKDQWFKHSTYCPEWTGLLYGTLIRFLCSDSRDERPRVVRVYYPLQACQFFIIDWFLMFVNQTQVGAT